MCGATTKTITSKYRWGETYAESGGTAPKVDFFSDLEAGWAIRTTLHFPTILVDTAGGWDPASDSYTVPEDGLYQVTYKSEVLHDPRFSLCLHIWIRRDGKLETLYSKNNLEQVPAYSLYPVDTTKARIAFQPMIDTTFYLDAGDVLYPMWIQFLPGAETMDQDVPAIVDAPYCENHMFKIAKIGN